MPQPNIICLAIDRLHAGYLGAYGNTWISTPALDRLASESFLLDRMTIDSTWLEMLYRSLWSGFHAMVPEHRTSGCEPLARQFADAGWRTALIADDRAVSDHPLAQAFAERILVESDSAITHRADSDRRVARSLEDTDAAAFFADVDGWLETARPPFLLWLHTGTLGRVWDAPLEFRAQYHDEDDPPAEDWAAVPNRMLTDDVDPDELLGLRHAYAGQVSLIDQLVGSLVGTVDQSRIASSTILVVFSPRGFPLAEHRRVGPCDDALHAELTQVPCLVRLPTEFGNSGRSKSLVQPADIFATLLDACGLGGAINANRRMGMGRSLMPTMGDETSATFDRACAVSRTDERRIVTPAWSLRVSTAITDQSQNSAEAETTPRAELFVKPDDWFEVNEVSDRCPQIAEQLQAVLAEFEQGCKSGEVRVSVPLASELVAGIE